MRRPGLRWPMVAQVLRWLGLALWWAGCGFAVSWAGLGVLVAFQVLTLDPGVNAPDHPLYADAQLPRLIVGSLLGWVLALGIAGMGGPLGRVRRRPMDGFAGMEPGMTRYSPPGAGLVVRVPGAVQRRLDAPAVIFGYLTGAPPLGWLGWRMRAVSVATCMGGSTAPMARQP